MPDPANAAADLFPAIANTSCRNLGEDIDKRTRHEDDQNVRTYARVFKVLSTQVDDSPINVRNTIGLPRMLDTYDDGTRTDAAARVNSIEPRQQDGSYNWLVTVTYSTLTNVWRTRADFGIETVHDGLEYDMLGGAIVNTAGDPMRPPQQRERGRLVITLTRVEPNPVRQVAFNPVSVDHPAGLVNDLIYRTNSLPWFGYPPGYVLLADVRARDMGAGPYVQHEVQYVFKVGMPHPPGFNYSRPNPGPWDRVLLNVGTRHLLPNGTRVVNVDVGRPVGHQALLDANGGLVSRNAAVAVSGAAIVGGPLVANAVAAAIDQPYWLVFTIFNQADFNILGLV